MRRLRFFVLSVAFSGLLAGCGEDQPNKSADEKAVQDPNFGKNASDMMKAANTGIDKKAANKPAAKP